MEAQNKIITRLQTIFERFLDENFATTNTVYFEKLITHLSAKENAFVLQAPFAMEWVNRCITIIDDDFSKMNPKVISFMLNFCSLMASNEWTIIYIREHRIMDRVLAIVNVNMQQFNPSIKLGTIRVIAAVAQYSLGLAYIRNAKAWHCLIEFCNNDHTLYVVRESRQLLYELLYKFSVKMNDEQIVLEMLHEILKPLMDNVFEECDESITINVDDSELQHKLSATLDLISYIFQKTLESEEKTNLAHLCRVHFKLSVSIWKVTEMTQNSLFLEKIMTAQSSLNFADLIYAKWESGQMAPESFNKFGVNFFNLMKFCIGRGECLNYIKLAQLNHLLWKKLGNRAPQEILIENERVRFENQLITFHLLPVLFILKSKEFLEEEIFDDYIMKIFNISCEQTLRICYAYRDVLYRTEATSEQLLADLSCKAIHGILSMENKLDRDQAVIVFQAMIYALKEFILSTQQEPVVDENTASTSSNSSRSSRRSLIEIPNVLHSVLVGLETLIQRYRITWKDSIETICVVNGVAMILENPNLTTRLAVQAFKLLQVSIEHFLSPNMALLVDNLQGSGLVRLGPIIVKRFHDPAWEVRDSTLELVTSIANISRLKFPAFQQFLADYEICPIVYQMAKNDSEAYVRASALKCLTKMVSINVIWEKQLSQMDLIDHLLFVLYNESEGIVRKEAVGALSKVYDQRKIPSALKDTLYSTIAHCVVVDLHWEVKIAALHFYELEMLRQLTNQGMIDGTFPTVTFSKENKKIVTLTAKEINLRILKAFNELAQRGCLGAILRCLHDDCDLEVVKVAVCMVHRILDKLKKYDYQSLIDSNAASPSSSNLSNTSTNSQTTKQAATSADETSAATSNSTASSQADAVIEDILDAQDINLLVSACEQQLSLNGDLHRYIDDQYYKEFTNVSSEDFLKTIRSVNFDQLLKNHHEWFLCAESFVSLLDDIVNSIKPDDGAMFADCY